MQKLLLVSLFLLVSSTAVALEVPNAAPEAQAVEGESADKPAEPAEESGAEEQAPAKEAPADEPSAAEASTEQSAAVEESASQVPADLPVVKVKEPLTPAAPDPIPAPAPVAEAKSKPAFEIGFGGYLRVHAATLTPGRFFGADLGAEPGNNPWVGRTDGFSIGDARLNMRAAYGDNLYVRLGFDGAVASHDDSLSPVGSLSTGLKDAYMRYSFGGSTQLFVGRFKPPFDIEELTSTADQQFVHSALESRGVAADEGNYAGGMAPGRQLGVMVMDPAVFSLSAMDIGYALALTNGNSGDATHNDNDVPALFGRLTMGWGSSGGAGDEEGPATQAAPSNGGVLGFSGYVNYTTEGNPPTRYNDQLLGAGMDLSLSYSGTFFRGQVLFLNTSHKSYPSAGSVQSLGGHAQLGYAFDGTGVEVAYRLGFYDPRFSVEQSDDAVSPQNFDSVMHHTLGARYDLEELPLTLWAEYTSSQEADGAALSNERVEFAMQVNF